MASNNVDLEAVSVLPTLYDVETASVPQMTSVATVATPPLSCVVTCSWEDDLLPASSSKESAAAHSESPLAGDAAAIDVNESMRTLKVQGYGFVVNFVRLLDRRWVKVPFLVLWFLLMSAGLIVALPFMEERSFSLPPPRGSASHEAQEAFEHYFPESPVDSALLVESGGKPFLSFAPGSTCSLSYNMSASGDEVKMEVSCSNASALGSGCITKSELIEESVSMATTLLADLVEPTVLAGVISQELLPTLRDRMPNVQACPVRAPGNLTDEFLAIPAQVLAALEAGQPSCRHQVLSFLNIPSQTVNTRLSVPLRGGGRNLSINLETLLPAGTFWDLMRPLLVTDTYTSAFLLAKMLQCGDGPIDPYSEDAGDFIKVLQQVNVAAPASLRAVSLRAGIDAIHVGVENTMWISSLTVPVAIAIVAFMTGSVRLVLCTIASLVGCMSSAFFIMQCVVWLDLMEVSLFAPSIMMAVILAMSIDYSLFLLTRYKEEVGDGVPVPAAVAIMLSTSGRIVFLSGLTLLLCFTSLLMFPGDLIASMGVGAAVSVFTALLSGLTLTPTVILVFPEFFSERDTRPLAAPVPLRRGGTGDSHRPPAAPLSLPRSDTGNSRLSRKLTRSETKRALSCWQVFGTWTQRLAWPIVLVLAAVAVPLAGWVLPLIHFSAGLTPAMPASSPTTVALTDLEERFGKQAVFPIQLIVVPRPHATSTEAARVRWLHDSCEALQAIAKAVDVVEDVPPFDASAFTGQMIMHGSCIEGAELGAIAPWSNVGDAYSATQVFISYRIDPFSDEGRAWITRLRKAVREHADVAEWHVHGEGALDLDILDLTYAKLPYMVAVMIVIVLVLMAVYSRSLVSPLRALVCLTWMLLVTIGTTVLAAGCGGLYWTIPVISMPVLIGLGLDYDIFYTERVVESRLQGLGPSEAAHEALAATANTISAAGIIMAIAFFPLVVCSTPMLRHIGLILTLGVCIDCFVSTKILVPAMIHVLGRVGFWPRRFDEGNVSHAKSGIKRSYSGIGRPA